MNSNQEIEMKAARWLESELRKMLRIKPEVKIPSDKHFIEFGFDSISLIELHGRIEDQYPALKGLNMREELTELTITSVTSLIARKLGQPKGGHV